MIRTFFLAAVLLAISTPALACQCDDPAKMRDADRQRQAEWIAGSGASIAEVELVRTPQGDHYRTVRYLFGPRQSAYPVRDPVGPITSCDYEITKKKRAIMVFLPQRPGAHQKQIPCGPSDDESRAGFVPAGMCTQFFIQAAGNLERVRRIGAP